MNNTNPIELFIVALLALVEGICWIINELAGFHESTAAFEPAETFDFNSIWQEHVASVTRRQDLTRLTVKQLQAMVGTKNSRYRKADLIQLALAY